MLDGRKVVVAVLHLAINFVVVVIVVVVAVVFVAVVVFIIQFRKCWFLLRR